jgi:hypothetical protein
MATATFTTVWQSADETTRLQAVEFWRELNLLPKGEAPERRAAELSVVAHEDDVLVAVATAHLAELPRLRVRLGMFRCAVAPGRRREGYAAELAWRTRDALEAWSAAHREQKLMGMGCLVQGAELSAKKAQPKWPISGMYLVGYTDQGDQIRVVWFKHARV